VGKCHRIGSIRGVRLGWVGRLGWSVGWSFGRLAWSGLLNQREGYGLGVAQTVASPSRFTNTIDTLPVYVHLLSVRLGSRPERVPGHCYPARPYLYTPHTNIFPKVRLQ